MKIEWRHLFDEDREETVIYLGDVLSVFLFQLVNIGRSTNWLLQLQSHVLYCTLPESVSVL